MLDQTVERDLVDESFSFQLEVFGFCFSDSLRLQVEYRSPLSSRVYPHKTSDLANDAGFKSMMQTEKQNRAEWAKCH